MPLSTAEMIARILVGAVLGAAIGVERDLHGRPAGLRTHTIVALASATFMVISTQFVYFQHYGAGEGIEVDPSRIAASIVSGIGFLGGGAILRTGVTIRGLTTAAGLWLVGAIGMAAGGGMFVVAGVVTAVGLGGLTLLRFFEDRGAPSFRQRVTVVLDQKQSPVSAVVEAFTKVGAVLSQEEYERQADDGRVRLTFDARTSTAAKAQALVGALDDVKGLIQLRIERL